MAIKEKWKEYGKPSIAVIESNRLAIGLTASPDKIKGDLDEVKRLNDLLEEKNKELLKLKEKTILSLNKEILEYQKFLSKAATAIKMYKRLIDRAEQDANAIKYDGDHIDFPHCQFESDIGIGRCNNPVSRISFGLACCEEHAIERDTSLK